MFLCFFFFNNTSTTEIYTLSLHDALPIYASVQDWDSGRMGALPLGGCPGARAAGTGDRKSTRLNSSHGYISYAVFCLKKKKNTGVVGIKFEIKSSNVPYHDVAVGSFTLFK